MSILKYFYRPKEKSTTRTLYNKTLLKTLTKEHLKIIKQMNMLDEKIEHHPLDAQKIKTVLKSIEIEILAHFMKEDIYLYTYLQDFYLDEEQDYYYIQSSKHKMKKIQQNIIHFFNLYTKEPTTIDHTFHQKFQDIQRKISKIKEIKEKEIYKFYLKEKNRELY